MMSFASPISKNPGGGGRDRTDDPLLAKQVLSQLSYAPVRYGNMVGLGGLEPPTSRLSSARSNQLSYKPESYTGLTPIQRASASRLVPRPRGAPALKGRYGARARIMWKKEKRRRQSLHCRHGCQADWLATFVLIGCLYMVPLAYPKSHTTFWATERP